MKENEKNSYVLYTKEDKYKAHKKMQQALDDFMQAYTDFMGNPCAWSYEPVTAAAYFACCVFTTCSFFDEKDTLYGIPRNKYEKLYVFLKSRMGQAL